MSNSIHISVARAMIDSGNPVDISLWTSKGEAQTWRGCVGMSFSRHWGTRQVKMLRSREIRTLRDVCIFAVNGLEVFI